MKNVVITTAVGLGNQEVEFFLKSLRKYYSDDIYFLVGKNDNDLKKILKFYDCQFYEVKDHGHDMQLKRYRYFGKILENNKKKYNQVLFCDCRDIYFQANPFEYKYKGLINFFSEDIPIKECSINSQWIVNTFGEKIYEEIKDYTVCCAGTVLANPSEMIRYLKLLDNLSLKYPFKKRLKYLLTFRRDKEGRGCDQAHGNYIVYNNFFKNGHLYSNREGPIATVYYLKNIKFNEKSQLLNELGQPYLIVHQYDKRWSEFSEKVTFLKNELNII